MSGQVYQDDDDFIRKISQMDERNLLRLVLSSPEYLTDAYYRRFAQAICRRGDELLHGGG